MISAAFSHRRRRVDLFGLAGVLLVTSEYRYGTIRPTFLFMPHRARVLSAKLIAGLLAGIVFGAVS